MCLKIFNNEVRVAEEDITCYKFLLVCSDNLHISPFQGFFYEIGKEYSSNLNPIRSEYEYDEDEEKTWRVVEEGLHSISDEKMACYFAEKKASKGKFNFSVVECIIPKGASYYEGTWRSVVGYASNRLKITKVIETFVPEEAENVP